MSSLSNIEEQLGEQPVKKRRVENSEEKMENAKPNEVNLLKSMEANKNKELETSTTMADLPSFRHHRKLPAELNCQIFYCLNLPTRRKFIHGLGWNFYAMFREILLIKSKRVCNPKQNAWIRSSGDFTHLKNGLVANNYTNGRQNVYAEKGFPISVADCRTDDFPGTICYYYEVKTLSKWCVVGFWQGGTIFGVCVNSAEYTYAIATSYKNGRNGGFQFQLFELPVGVKAKSNAQGNVYGCGILMDPDNKLTTFFTLNGILLGKQIPISPLVDRLVPSVSIFENASTLEANFGNDNDKDKPFAYDIRNCPGMGLDCI